MNSADFGSIVSPVIIAAPKPQPVKKPPSAPRIQKPAPAKPFCW